MISEMIHTASLIHDDVIDQSNFRRGKPSVNVLWNHRKVSETSASFSFSLAEHHWTPVQRRNVHLYVCVFRFFRFFTQIHSMIAIIANGLQLVWLPDKIVQFFFHTYIQKKRTTTQSAWMKRKRNVLTHLFAKYRVEKSISNANMHLIQNIYVRILTQLTTSSAFSNARKYFLLFRCVSLLVAVISSHCVLLFCFYFYFVQLFFFYFISFASFFFPIHQWHCFHLERSAHVWL